MSWSFSAHAHSETAATELAQALEGAFLPNEEMRDQAAACVSAAVEIIKGGSLGAGEFVVSLNGHANPGHEIQPGWSNDFVNVNIQWVSSATRPAEPVEASAPKEE